MRSQWLPNVLEIAAIVLALSAFCAQLVVASAPIVASAPVAESPGSSTSTRSEAGTAAAGNANVDLAQAQQAAKETRKKSKKLRRQGAARSSTSQLGLQPLPVAANMNIPDPFVAPDRELEGQLAAYSGITSKGDVWSPNLRGSGGFNEKEKWRSNPYWRYGLCKVAVGRALTVWCLMQRSGSQPLRHSLCGTAFASQPLRRPKHRRYFRRVWGSAPFIDANFRLWLSGALKGEFSKPNRVVKGQTTKALPAALRYFDSRLRINHPIAMTNSTLFRLTWWRASQTHRFHNVHVRALSMVGTTP